MCSYWKIKGCLSRFQSFKVHIQVWLKSSIKLFAIYYFFQARSRLQQSVRSPKSSLDPQHQNPTLITGTLLSPVSSDFQGSALFQIFKMFLSKMLKAADHPMLMGKGGRMVSQLTNIVLISIFQPNNEVRKMQGMNLASLRHHVALQVYFCSVK